MGLFGGKKKVRRHPPIQVQARKVEDNNILAQAIEENTRVLKAILEELRNLNKPEEDGAEE